MPKNKPQLPERLSNYKPLVEITCAFCKGRVQAVEFADGSHGVTHALPECAEFTVMEPVTFLRENRKIIQRDLIKDPGQAN